MWIKTPTTDTRAPRRRAVSLEFKPAATTDPNELQRRFVRATEILIRIDLRRKSGNVQL